MTTPFLQRGTGEIATEIAAALPPRPPCIEMIDPVMAQVLRDKTEWERLQIAAGMWRSARRLLQAVVQQENPAWTADEVTRETVRRMSHGLVRSSRVAGAPAGCVADS